MILALDIAFKNLGWSVFRNGELIDYGTIQTNKSKIKNLKVSDDRATRGNLMATTLNEIIKKHNIRGIVGEMPSGSQNAVASNLLGWASGIVVGVAAVHGIPCEWISQGDSKKAAVGVRAATKETMMDWARQQYPFVEFPTAANQFEHVADSLAAYNGLKSGVLVRAFG